MDEKPRIWTSRKFASAWCLTWLATGLLVFKHIEGAIWSSTVSMIWLGYMTSNVGEKYVEGRTKIAEVKADAV